MRMLVMFNLPVTTKQDQRNYRQFVKRLENLGFVRIQYSIYVKVCTSFASTKEVEQKITPYIHKGGIVQTLVITEKQYAGMHFLTGTPSRDVRNLSERLVIL